MTITVPPVVPTEPEPDRRAVIDGKIVYTSVSAMQKFSGCPRQWYFRYVLRMKEKPPGAGLLRGTEGHKRLAHYLQTGQDILDPLESLGVQRGLVPKPPISTVEHPIDGVLTAGPLPMKGSIDLYVPQSPVPQSLVLSPAIVRDWKFKADIGKWGATADDLIDPEKDAGIQMLGYARYAVLQGAQEVNVSHVSFQTRGRPDVVMVETKIRSEFVDSAWEQVVNRIVPEMIHSARQQTYHDVRPVETACDKYGGCAYRDTCLNKTARLIQGFRMHATQEQTMAMPKPPASPVVTVAAPAPIQAPLKASMAKKGASYQLPDGSTGIHLSEVTTATDTFYSFATGKGKPTLLEANDIVLYIPPAAEPVAAAPAPVETPKPRRMALPAIVREDAPPAEQPATEATKQEPVAPSGPITEPVAPTAEAPAKRGRPAGSKNVQRTESAERSAPQPSGVSLYYGCSPVGVVTQTLHAWVERLEAEVIKIASTSGASPLKEGDDLRTADDKAMGFGKWKGYLAAAAKVSPPPPGHYIVTEGDERISVAADALSPSVFVVRS